jgi:hypothetical protein
MAADVDLISARARRARREEATLFVERDADGIGDHRSGAHRLTCNRRDLQGDGVAAIFESFAAESGENRTTLAQMGPCSRRPMAVYSPSRAWAERRGRRHGAGLTGNQREQETETNRGMT